MIAYDVQLTEKALSVLSWVPSSLFTPKASLGQRLTVLVKSGSKEGASELLRQIIQFSFASMTNLFR